MLGAAPRGISRRTIQSMIDDAVGDVTLPGKTGWVHGPVTSLAGSGVTAVDFLGIPVEANEVVLSVRQASGTYTYSDSVQMSLNVFNAGGGLVESGYMNYMSVMRGTGLTGVATNTYAAQVANWMGPSDLVTARIHLMRLSNDEWIGVVNAFNRNSGTYLAGFQTPAVGAGIRGVRLKIALGNFDAGSGLLSWRR